MNNALTRTLLLASFFLALGSQNAIAQFWVDSFEGAGPSIGTGTRVVAGHGSNDGTWCSQGNYFFASDTLTDGGALGGPLGMSADFSMGSPGPDGSRIWRGEDLDACIQNPDIVEWTGIDISGRTNLDFFGLFAARDTLPFEGTDEIRVEFKIDAGAYATILLFEDVGGNLAQTIPATGTVLTLTLTEFMADIPGSGTTMDIRVSANVNGGSEEFAFDRFQMTPVELQSFEIE